MHTVTVLGQALEFARRVGFTVRQEWLGGCGGGACEVKGHKCLFVDLSLPPLEQLEQVLAALREDPQASQIPISEALATLLSARKTA